MPVHFADLTGAPASAETRTPAGSAFRGQGNGRAVAALRGGAPAPVVRKPKVTIVITHYDYSDLVAGAIDSALAQTYENVDCIVVDDCSDPAHQRALRAIVESRQCDRLRLIVNEANIGQIPSFYVGVDSTDADFVCLLDPDDRYFPTFVAEMVEAHLNPYVVAPMVCCEQVYSARGRQLTGGYLTERHHAMLLEGIDHAPRTRFTLRLHGVETREWPWTSTSSMLFRRTAMELMRPSRQLRYKGSADAYLARGAQFLGGTLVFDKPLVVREVHERNDWLNSTVLSTWQTKHNAARAMLSVEPACRADVLISILDNEGGALFPAGHFARILKSCFDADERAEVVARSRSAAQLWTGLASHEASLVYREHARASRAWRLERGWLLAFGKVLSMVLAKAPPSLVKLAFAGLLRPFGEERYARLRNRPHRKLMAVAGAASGLFGPAVPHRRLGSESSGT